MWVKPGVNLRVYTTELRKHVLPRLQREATEGDLDAADEATEEAEAAVFMPDDDTTDAAELETEIPLAAVELESKIDLPPPRPPP